MSEEFDLIFKASIGGREQVDEFFRHTEQGAQKAQANIAKAMSATGAAISQFADKAQASFQGFAGKELGGSLGAQARGVLQLRDAISQLAVSSGNGTEIVGELKDQIQKTSTATGQLQENVTEALSAFVEKTGDIETARKNIELYGKAATATSASLSDIARVGVELSDKLNIKDQAQAFAILAQQSKAGAIELRDLATKGPRIFAAAASAGATGEEGLREAGALAQTYAKGFGGRGSAARVATAVERTFSDLLKHQKQIDALGIVTQGRDQFDVLKDVIAKTGGDKQKLLKIFGIESIRGVDVLAREYRQTHGFGTFEQFRNITAGPEVLDRDFRTRMATGEAKIRQTQIERQRLFDKFLGGASEFAAEHATAIQVGTLAAGGLGSGLSLASRFLNLRKGGAGAGAGGLSSLTAQRVFVVNWPAGAFGGTGGPGVPTPGASKGLLDDAKALLGGSAGLVGAGVLGVGLLTAGVSYYGAHQNDDLVKKLEDADKKQAAQALADRELRKNTLTRHSGGVVLAAPGKSLGTLPPEGADVKNSITINIAGDDVKVEHSGTRAPDVMVRRRAAGGG